MIQTFDISYRDDRGYQGQRHAEFVMRQIDHLRVQNFDIDRLVLGWKTAYFLGHELMCGRLQGWNGQPPKEFCGYPISIDGTVEYGATVIVDSKQLLALVQHVRGRNA